MTTTDSLLAQGTNVGLARTVYIRIYIYRKMVISKPKILYVHCKYMVLANPTQMLAKACYSHTGLLLDCQGPL